jgi:hypothetical protein
MLLSIPDVLGLMRFLCPPVAEQRADTGDDLGSRLAAGWDDVNVPTQHEPGRRAVTTRPSGMLAYHEANDRQIARRA